jgi:hypothetical protein
VSDGPATDAPPAPADPVPAAPTSTDRWLLAAFGAWVLLLLVGAFAQVTDNRAILDLFDLHRWFTR